MARIRTIKPDFFRHEGLFEAEKAEGLPLRIAFAGLWTAADREGRFRWQPRQLKLDCLPYDEVNFSRVLDALATRGFISKYVIDGKEYGFIPSWRQHQVINNRESDSDLPNPSPDNILLTREERVVDACPTGHGLAQGEGKGKEGEREGKGNTEPNGSDAGASRDLRSDLFDRGLKKIAALTGKGPDSCRSFVGKCLKAADDDAGIVLGLIEDAERNRVVDPAGWISARLKGRGPPAQQNETEFRRKQRESREILEAMNDYARRGSGGSGADFGSVPGNSGDQSQRVFDSSGKVVELLPVHRG